MIIVLKGANFSGNNLGKIAFEDLSERTKEILSNFSKSMGMIKKLAVQSLVDGIEEKGLSSKIKGLYLPILAGKTDEAFINVLDSDFAKLVSSELALDEYGVHSSGTSTGLYVDTLNGLTTNNFHFLMWINKLDTSSNVKKVVQLIGEKESNTTYTFIDMHYTQAYGGIACATISNFRIASVNAEWVNSGGAESNKFLENTFGGWNFKYAEFFTAWENGVKTNTESGSNKDMSNFSSWINGNTKLPDNINIKGLKNDCLTSTLSILSVGQGLTDSEMSEYSKLINEFMKSWGVVK